MFVKSLLLFTGIGVISGLMFGIYLIDVKQTGQLVFVEGSSLSLVTEKSDFKKGEPISIRIINSGTVPIQFPDTSYGLRVTGLSGIMMYEPGGLDAISILEPREEAIFVWDQMKNDKSHALEGLYKIHAGAKDLDGYKVEKSITITIWK